MKIGIQLYTLRDAAAKDYAGTLEGIKRLGYDSVELAGYGGYSAEDLKKLCAGIGLEIVSTHHGLDGYEDIEASADYVAALGLKYAAIPWMPAENIPGREGFPATREKFIAIEAALRARGVQLLYHNHDFEFVKGDDGEYAYDKLFEAVPGLNPEIDVCWVKYAGCSPVDYIKKYAGRVDILHLKDFEGHKSERPAYALIDKDGNALGGEQNVNTFKFRPVGYGCQDIPAILEAAEASGTHTVIVEQDDCYGDAWGDAEKSLRYLQKLLK